MLVDMTIHRARTNEGSLTIRIPRHFGGKNTPTLSQPLSSPTPTNDSHSRIVAKSKSLTTSMDKLSLPKQRSPSGCSSRDFSVGGSRNSTPSSARSAAAVSRPNSRKSVHSVRSRYSAERSASENEERNKKSFSPAGSEASLQSVTSSTHSVNSSHSVHSAESSSASVGSHPSHPSNKSDCRSIVRASSEPPTSSLVRQKPPSNKVCKSVSPVSLQGRSNQGSRKTTPVRSSLSASSLNSWSGDVRLEETHNIKMSRKSTSSSQTPSVGSGFQRQNVRQTTNKKSLPVFNSYMSLFQVQEKLKRGEVIEGVLRINPKSYEDAYISAPDGGMDIFIGGVHDRNTALHGDVVAALINPPDQWKILYAQLDAFLEEQEHLKHFVYNESNPNPNVSNSDCASASSLCNSYNTNIVNNHIFNEKNINKSQVKCDVVVKEEENRVPIENMHQKRKKHRRGKKKKNLKENVESLKAISTNNKSPVIDSVEVNSWPSGDEINVKQEKTSTSSDIMIVPPDQLSECDLTNDDDDDSVHSLTLDFQEHHVDTKSVIKNNKATCSGIACNSLGIPLGSVKVSDDVKINLKNENSIQSSQVDSSKRLKHITSKETMDAKGNLNKSLKETDREPNVAQNHLNDPSFKDCKLETVSPQLKKCPNVKKELSVEQVMRLPHWEKFVQKTAMIVRIMERKHPLLAAGVLKPQADKNPHMALFSPFDSRIPRIKILMKNCPKDFLARSKYYSKFIYLAKITEWNEPKFAFGVLCRDIGQKGDIEAETESILIENSIDSSEFPESVLKCIPKLPWTIPDEEIKRRNDFRKSVIFTIDPSTARDLDDAVSCLQLPNGNFRVGVHIADASYFVPVDSELDRIAAERANSVYLVQKVIPMLPRPLCEELCSLNPGEDRLTFSLVWELTPEGNIVGDWFGRTIIRSCVKLSYEDAQQMIDNDGELNPDSFPPISGDVSFNEISSIIKNLHSIAVKLRNKRATNGALKLNQAKIGFSLNFETKTPDGIVILEQKESNSLIEEFMLLANITVAHKISAAFPKLALLRKHPPPHDVQIENALKFLRHRGIHLDASSSKTLSDSIQRYYGTDLFSLARMQLIVNMCSKPMQYARYICSGIATKAIEQHHYALNVPCYTHFTSPIRRYADIIVHRLLASALDREQNPLPRWTSVIIEKLANHCNEKKQASKIVQEVSIELYLSLFIRSVGEMIENGIIIGILDRCIDVLLTRLGVIKRCYMEKLPLNSFLYVQEEDALFIEWKECHDSHLPKLTQKLTYFDMVTVILRPFENDDLKFNAFLVRPEKINTN